MSENNVTLSDLANGAIPTASPVGMPTKKLDKSNIHDVNLNDVALPSEKGKPVEGTGNPMLDAAFLGIDETIDRLSNESTEIYQKGEMERIEKAVNSDTDLDNDDILESTSSNTIRVNKFDDNIITNNNTVAYNDDNVHIITPNKPDMIEQEVRNSAPVAGTKKENISIVKDPSIYDDTDDDDLFANIEDEDLKFLDDEEEDSENSSDESKEKEEEKIKTEEIKKNIRNEMNNNFTPVEHRLDLSKFSISKKPINASKVINDIKNKAIECADGVLFKQNRAVRMSAYKPMEIQSIDPNRVKSSNYNKFIENKLKLIYDHIIDANKPKTFEAWTMITPNTVLDDYMFTAYKATFGIANILTFNCSDEKCSNVFMENVPVHSMIKFSSDEVKEKYMSILHEGSTDSTDTNYEVDLYQASDEYVFALKVPSLYNTYIEPSLVDRAFNEKYEDLLLLLSYIDSVYRIDYNSNELIPIDTKPVPNNKSLTYKRRVKTFATILKSLTSDQLQALSVETDKYDAGKLDDDGNLVRDITYVYPERRCPKCGKKIDEVEVSPDNMLFTRHQLGLMKKI